MQRGRQCTTSSCCSRSNMQMKARIKTWMPSRPRPPTVHLKGMKRRPKMMYLCTIPKFDLTNYNHFILRVYYRILWLATPIKLSWQPFCDLIL
jgi:hypothetical protein